MGDAEKHGTQFYKHNPSDPITLLNSQVGEEGVWASDLRPFENQARILTNIFKLEE